MSLAYADESGHSADPNCRHLGICAVVAPGDSWDRLARQWSERLDDTCVAPPFFNATSQYVGPLAESMRSRLPWRCDFEVSADLE